MLLLSSTAPLRSFGGLAGVWRPYRECLYWGEKSEKLQNVIGGNIH